MNSYLNLAYIGTKWCRSCMRPLPGRSATVVLMLSTFVVLTLVFHEACLLSGAPERKNVPELG
jgi:hypothetical protein